MTDEREQRLFEVLEAYEQAIQAGDAPDRQALLAEHPDLAAELAGYLDAQASLLRLTEPLRPLAEAIAPDASATLSTSASEGSESPFAPGDRVVYFGDYEIQGTLGRGGMAVVYLARQLSLKRPVALKFILAGSLASEADVQRFRNEAEAVATLDHPGILPIFEVGLHQGLNYLAMKLIEGGSLDARLAEYTADPRAAAKLLASVARAVHHAHHRGVLHRDLKPSNILVDRQGQPYVTDFGLARRIDGGSELTQSGALLGSPPYMAPEQTTGQRGEVTTSTDVYGLGAILYAMLAGRPPFRAGSVMDTIEQVRRRPPEPPAALNPRVDRDLQTICLKALDKAPPRRYASAQELAEDLDRWLEGRPILARRTGPVEKAWRWARRNPLVAGLSSLVLLLALAGVAGLAVSNAMISRRNMVVEQERDKAKVALAESEASRRQAEAVSQFLVAAFRKPDPSQDGRELKVVDLLGRAATDLEVEPAVTPRVKAELFDALGNTFLGLGLPDQAAKVFEKAIALLETSLGPDHMDTVTSRGNLAAAFDYAGRTAEAIALGKQVLKATEENFGPDHPETLVSLNNLAASYDRANRTAEAIPLYERVYKSSEKSFGPTHVNTLKNRNNLASAYNTAGRTAEAIALHEKTLRLEEKSLGFDHPATLTSRVNLATAYNAAGLTAEAISLHQQTLTSLQEKLGPDHWLTLTCRNNLGVAYDTAGQYVQSEVVYREVLDRSLHEYGPGDPRTVIAMAQLGANLIRQAKWAEAEPILRQCLAFREKTESDAWTTFSTRAFLGGSLLGLGRYAEAEPLILSGYEGLKAREAAINSFYKGHLRDAAGRVVRLYEAWGKPDKAKEWEARLGLVDLPADVFARP